LESDNATVIRPRRLTQDEVRIDEAIQDQAAADPHFAQAYATLRLAEQLGEVKYALHLLGSADASSPLGAVEMLAGEVKTLGRILLHALSQK
jgi:hypothetical protein